MLKQVFFSKVENIRNHSPLKAIILILKHVGKINSEYPAKTDYRNLTKQKKNPSIAGAPSVYTESIILISRSCFEKNSSNIGRYILLMVLFRFSQKKKSSILVLFCTNLINAISKCNVVFVQF